MPCCGFVFTRTAYVTVYIITKMFDDLLQSFLFFLFLVSLHAAINASVQYNGGLLTDIILLTQCFYHTGTRLKVMNRFCICSL